jgi:hypothetical protein
MGERGWRVEQPRRSIPDRLLARVPLRGEQFRSDLALGFARVTLDGMAL